LSLRGKEGCCETALLSYVAVREEHTTKGSRGLLKPFDIQDVSDHDTKRLLLGAPIRTCLLACEQPQADNLSDVTTAGESGLHSGDVSSIGSDDISERGDDDFDDMIFAFDEEARPDEILELVSEELEADVENSGRTSNLSLADMFFFEA
jgi:hypothetical protein